jgi:hypothetical protein
LRITTGYSPSSVYPPYYGSISERVRSVERPPFPAEVPDVSAKLPRRRETLFPVRKAELSRLNVLLFLKQTRCCRAARKRLVISNDVFSAPEAEFLFFDAAFNAGLVTHSSRRLFQRLLYREWRYGFLPASGFLRLLYQGRKYGFLPASGFLRLLYREWKYGFSPDRSRSSDKKQVRPRNLFQQPQAVSEVAVSGMEVRLFA